MIEADSTEAIVLAGYLEHLVRNGRAVGTINSHRLWILRFLDDLKQGGIPLAEVRIEDIDAYFAHWLPTLARQTRPIPVGSIRGFLAYAHRQGMTKVDFSTQIIGIRVYQNEYLPRGLDRVAIERVLSLVDRDTDGGSRDYAILILMAAYGLRLSEVLALTPQMVDWEHDKLRFWRPKTKDWLELPLLPEVGNALLDHLRGGHSPSQSETIFFFPQKEKPAAVMNIVRRYFRKAGIALHGRVTSLFRHSVGMEMVRQGVPIKSIADALGHRSLASTYVYAKSDIERLRSAALPFVGDDEWLRPSK